jgi:REP element-mobilizing transposase RayT
VAFLAHLGEVEELAKWVRKAIHAHQVATLDMTIDPDLVHLFVPPSFITLRYNKMRAYRNHFRIDSD